MKTLLLIASINSSLSAPTGTAECATISDTDTRMMCFAVQTNNSSCCSFIKDNDKRIQCRLLVKG